MESKILFQTAGKEVARITFTYGASIYAGKSSVEGPMHEGLTKIIEERATGVYCADMGGPVSGSHPESWSWLLAVAYWATHGEDTFADEFVVVSSPKKRLFREPPKLPSGSIA